MLKHFTLCIPLFYSFSSVLQFPLQFHGLLLYLPYARYFINVDVVVRLHLMALETVYHKMRSIIKSYSSLFLSGLRRRPGGGARVLLLDVRALQDPPRVQGALLGAGAGLDRGHHIQLILPVGANIPRRPSSHILLAKVRQGRQLSPMLI